MCGIAGFSGNFDQSLLERMGSLIAHRGPDDSGIYWVGNKGIGLAHRRLSIIDLSPLGHQPMWDGTKKVVIVFNGEIYNYRELREELLKEGFVFKSHSDTEILLNLYLRDGTDMLRLLNGIFSFALWDTRTESLFIARDGVGVKPLYYAETPKGFLFASELKALLQEPSVDRTINTQAVHYYLTYLWAPAPHTMLKSVKKLKPGGGVVVKKGRIQRHWQFYDLPYDQAIENISVEDAKTCVRDHIRQAVRRQMVADVPVGAFLSGGLDSSAVVAFAREITDGRKLQCFTIGFKDKASREEGMIDDLPYAKAVAEHLGVELNTIYVDSTDMAMCLEKMIYHLDEPQADPAPINALLISKLAREHGIKVLLSGAGGDDIFTGYRRHYALMQEKFWTWMPKNARCCLSSIAANVPASNPSLRRISKAFQYANLDGDERLISYFFWTKPEAMLDLYGPEMRQSAGSVSASVPLLESLANLDRNVAPINRMLYLEGKHFLADHNLNYTDKMSMANGVEVRVPLLDPDLMALAARLPVRFKQRGRVGKWIFKKAMEPFLPGSVIYRPKTGFGAPLRRWIKHELRPVIDDALSSASLKKRGLFDPEGVSRLVRSDESGRLDGSYTIFSLVCIELWCRLFLDRQLRSY